MSQGSSGVLPSESFQHAHLSSVCWQDGAEVTWGATILNGGPLPVTVTGFEPPDESFLTEPKVLMRNSQGWEQADGYEEFAPYRLGSGEETRMIIFSGRYLGCESPASSDTTTVGVHSFAVVHYRVFGLDRTDKIPFDFQVQVPCHR